MDKISKFSNTLSKVDSLYDFQFTFARTEPLLKRKEFTPKTHMDDADLLTVFLYVTCNKVTFIWFAVYFKGADELFNFYANSVPNYRSNVPMRTQKAIL